MENKSKYSEILKTDSFFIGKKSEKKAFIENQKDKEFKKILKFIWKENRKQDWREKRLELRHGKKDWLYAFEKKANSYDFTMLKNYDNQTEFILGKEEYIFINDSKGYFRGNPKSAEAFKLYLLSLDKND